MPIAFARLSHWVYGTKYHESTNTGLNSSSDSLAFGDPDSVTFPPVNEFRMRSSERRMQRKWRSREERRLRIDREYDMVIVPSDGDCLSGSDSDGSDWSVGWMEPHGPDFLTGDGDTETSFAVLVPCYGRGRCEKRDLEKRHALGEVVKQKGFSYDNSDYIERWLSSLQECDGLRN
ncbi:hypothetical protein AXF42_Ash016395 [Apostasia shenzhenica]|uniref:Uncharacterized protein n=1 Tax=Apostasia shenzhenica TaxID=1088818 RepID=A0A2I0A007_9ASPA|nr:hypothetical protein AXF42_Ash016395 [Apostasia shenzhenica]